MSFSDILRNDYFDTFGENFDFDTLKNDTFESICVDRHPQYKTISTVLSNDGSLNFFRISMQIPKV